MPLEILYPWCITILFISTIHRGFCGIPRRPAVIDLWLTKQCSQQWKPPTVGRLRMQVDQISGWTTEVRILVLIYIILKYTSVISFQNFYCIYLYIYFFQTSFLKHIYLIRLAKHSRSNTSKFWLKLSALSTIHVILWYFRLNDINLT